MTKTSFIKSIYLSAVTAIRAAMRFIANQSAGRLLMFGSVLAMLIFAFVLAVQAVTSIIFFEGYAANGAFQLMNPLRRLAAGEIIGNDFNFFHGLAVPLVHLPFYYLFGQGLFGSEAARWLVSPGVFLVSAFLFFYVLRRRFVFAFSMTAFVTTVSMLAMPFLALPLTSLLGVRSVTPVFLMIVMLYQQKLRRPLFKRIEALRSLTLYEVLAGLLLAVGFISGTEFGVAGILAFFIANTFYKSEAGQSFRSRIFSSLRTAGLLAAWLLALLTVITRGTPLEPLKYALGEIPGDQFWYFGVPPNNYLQLGSLLPTILHDGKLILLLIIAALGAVLLFLVHRLGKHRVQSQAFLFGMLAGMFALVSFLGYYHYSSASALGRMALLVGGASAVILYGYWRKSFPVKFEFGKLKVRWSFGPVQGLKLMGWLLIAGVVAYGAYMLHETRRDYDIVALARKTKAYVLRQDTGILDRDWRVVDEQVMMIVQADNNVAVADVNDDEYKHGVSSQGPRVMVDPGEHASFIKPGQIVYFVKSGRQIIRSVEPSGDLLKVTLVDDKLSLDAGHDGAPAKMIVAESFDRDDTKVWSIYSGLIESEMGILNPTTEGYDYIIHALGEERRKEYVDDFKRMQPEFVLTLGKPYFRYEEWVQNAHWDLYSIIDQNYEVVKETPIYVVWKKRGDPWQDTHKQTQPWQPLTVNEAEQKIDLPALSFSSVPDMEAYFLEIQKAENEKNKAAGREPAVDVCGAGAEHDQYLVDQAHALRQYEYFRRENSGPETDVTEHQLWLNTVTKGHSVLDVSPPPELCPERAKRQVVLVKLKYEVSHPLEKLPLLGKTTRYFVEPNNVYSRTIVSLRPYDNEIVFPVVISEANSNSYLRLNVDSMLPGKGKLKITSAEWTLLDTSLPNLKALTERP